MDGVKLLKHYDFQCVDSIVHNQKKIQEDIINRIADGSLKLLLEKMVLLGSFKLF